MDRQRVVDILREHESELRGAGLLHLRLFGSVEKQSKRLMRRGEHLTS